MPSLPVELERMIFELAALQDDDHDNRVRIILVAKRVYEWIRPIMYRVAIAKAESPFEPLSDTPQTPVITIKNWRNTKITDVGQFVRHLLTLTKQNESPVLELLSAFPNVENLAIWQAVPMSSDVLEAINKLPLRILSTDMAEEELQEAIKTCQALKNLTHLELLSWDKSTYEDFNPLLELRNLTHLCLDITDEDEEYVLPDLLKLWPSLEALIYLGDTEPEHAINLLFIGTPLAGTTVESADPRFLFFRDLLPTKDSIAEWEASANGHIGFWELADTIIQARKDKLFKDAASFVFSRETWMDDLNDRGIRWYEEWSAAIGYTKFKISDTVIGGVD